MMTRSIERIAPGSFVVREYSAGSNARPRTSGISYASKYPFGAAVSCAFITGSYMMPATRSAACTVSGTKSVPSCIGMTRLPDGPASCGGTSELQR